MELWASAAGRFLGGKHCYRLLMLSSTVVAMAVCAHGLGIHHACGTTNRPLCSVISDCILFVSLPAGSIDFWVADDDSRMNEGKAFLPIPIVVSGPPPIILESQGPSINRDIPFLVSLLAPRPPPLGNLTIHQGMGIE